MGTSQTELSELIDAAERAAREHLRAPEDVRAIYDSIAVDLRAFAYELLERSEGARAASAAAVAGERREVAASAASEREVDNVRRWVARLKEAAERKPAAAHLSELLGRPGTEPIDSWLSAMQGLDAMLARAASGSVVPADLGLPADYLDQGRAMKARMIQAREEEIRRGCAALTTMRRARECEWSLREYLPRLRAARDLGMMLSGRELPAWPLPDDDHDDDSESGRDD